MKTILKSLMIGSIAAALFAGCGKEEQPPKEDPFAYMDDATFRTNVSIQVNKRKALLNKRIAAEEALEKAEKEGKTDLTALKADLDAARQAVESNRLETLAIVRARLRKAALEKNQPQISK